MLFNVKRNRIVLRGGDDSEGDGVRDEGWSFKLLLVVLVGFRIRGRVPVRYVGQVGYALQYGGRGKWRS